MCTDADLTWSAPPWHTCTPRTSFLGFFFKHIIASFNIARVYASNQGLATRSLLRGSIPSTLRYWGVNHTHLQSGV
jgi:hypothetical protein